MAQLKKITAWLQQNPIFWFWASVFIFIFGYLLSILLFSVSGYLISNSSVSWHFKPISFLLDASDVLWYFTFVFFLLACTSLLSFLKNKNFFLRIISIFLFLFGASKFFIYLLFRYAVSTGGI